MNIISILEIFATVLTALGGWEFIKFLMHRRQERRLKEAEADIAESEVDQSKVATENAMRDMYEETLARMRELDEKRIAEIRQDYQTRITELNKANAELHKTNLELLKAGARKDDIIVDKTAKIRELQELRNQDATKIGELEGDVQYLDCWKCYREFGKGENDCDRREPQQNPPLKFKPRKK